MATTDKVIISVAVNGATLQRADTPHVPLTPVEIAGSVVEAHEAGAAIAHVHVRSEDGAPSSDVTLYREVMQRVRARCDVLLNFSTDMRQNGGADCLALGPEIASLPVGSVNLGDELMAAPRPAVFATAAEMRASAVRAELEIFHEGMVGAARQLVDAGLVDDPVLCQFCLGFDGGAPADVGALVRLIEALPSHWRWSVAVEGDDGLALHAVAIARGGHVRVGLEDSPYYHPGELAGSNAQLVRRMVRLAQEFGRPIATTADARAMLGITT